MWLFQCQNTSKQLKEDVGSWVAITVHMYCYILSYVLIFQNKSNGSTLTTIFKDVTTMLKNTNVTFKNKFIQRVNALTWIWRFLYIRFPNTSFTYNRTTEMCFIEYKEVRITLQDFKKYPVFFLWPDLLLSNFTQ